MADLLQTLIIAITLGSLYALISLGYTMVYGILQLINFAHSDIVVLGAWLSYTIATFALPRLGIGLDAPPWYAGVGVLIGAMILCGLIGFAIERLAYKPIRKAPRLNALITAIGVSLFLQNVGQLHATIVPAETKLAAGSVMGRGTAPNSIKLDAPITLSKNTSNVLKLLPANTSTPTQRTITAPPGTYKAGDELTLDQPVGRAMTRDATYTLSRVSTPLVLPFGAAPVGVPALLPPTKLWSHEFTSTIVQSDGTRGTVVKPITITWLDTLIVALALLLMLALEILIYHTRLGTAMRAVSYNFDTAGLMGIPVDRIISLTFVIGAMLAAAAGFLYAVHYQQIQQPAHATWVLLGLKAFVAAVVGGIGNVRGAAVGGFLIAFIEQFSAVYFQRIFHWDNAAAFTDVYVFALLIIVLLVKPAGLFGSTAREKV